MEIEILPDGEPPLAPPPTEATLLSDLPLVSLDTETTGLEPERDRIVAIGAVRLHGRHLYRSCTFDVLVRPGRSIPPGASAIHGITDAMVEQAEEISAIWPRLQVLLARTAVVGHHIDFDLSILAAEARRHRLPWNGPLALDTATLCVALDGLAEVPELQDASRRYGIVAEGRHTALGDGLTAARLYLRLIPKLLERGVFTLGDAIRFGRDAARGASWRRPQSGATLGEQPALRRLDAFPYLRRVGEVMARPLVTIEPRSTVAQAAAILTERRVSSLVMLDSQDRPLGILTERDVVRAVAGSRSEALSAAVTTISSSPVATVDENDYVYVAIGRLDRLGFRHLVVVDGKGSAIGMVTARALLRQRSADALHIADQVDAASDAPSLAGARAKLPGLAQALLSEGIAAPEIAAVLSSVLRDITRKATQIAIAAMTEAGRGPPPAPWAMLVLGSGGRGESLLGPDQDNALVHLGTDADDAWFAELGRRVADLLDQAGIPYCRGGVMARESAWRHTLGGWSDVVRRWAGAASPKDVLAADIFFDFVAVAGDRDLAERLRRVALAEVTGSPMFLQQLAVDLARTRAPLSLFGKLQGEAGRLDLKLHGLLPIVGAARALALRHGIESTSTPERLRLLAKAGHLADADLVQQTEAHALLMRLSLEQQVADAATGRIPRGKVEIARLDRPAQKRLGKALKQVEAFATEVGAGLV